MHPKSGEVMLGGHLQGSGMGNMSRRCLDVGHDSYEPSSRFMYARAGRDKVVTAPAPKITMVSGSKTQMVPVAEMEGVGEGLKDFPFGNNVQMMKDQIYTVRVTEASDHAVSHVDGRLGAGSRKPPSGFRRSAGLSNCGFQGLHLVLLLLERGGDHLF
jgi:hypothetical protein